MLNVKYSARILWYAQKLNKQIRVGRNRGLYRVAGLIRTSTKRSMRLRARASVAGSPPHAHTRAGLRQIEFIVDDAAGAALVGPIKFSGSNFFDSPVPHIHEFGGVFLSRSKLGRYWNYPERSFMYSTLKKLSAAGKIPAEFSVAMGRVL